MKPKNEQLDGPKYQDLATTYGDLFGGSTGFYQYPHELDDCWTYLALSLGQQRVVLRLLWEAAKNFRSSRIPADLDRVRIGYRALARGIDKDTARSAISRLLKVQFEGRPLLHLVEPGQVATDGRTGRAALYDVSNLRAALAAALRRLREERSGLWNEPEPNDSPNGTAPGARTASSKAFEEEST
jgi:hypothetical protein